MDKIIKKILDGLLHKPQRYHYICHGGSSVGPMVDKWGDTPETHCGNTGDGFDTEHGGGWINAPQCKHGCDRVIKGSFEISRRERNDNYCYNLFANKLRSELGEAELPASDNTPKATIQPCVNSGCVYHHPAEKDGSNCISYHYDEIKERCSVYKAEQ